MDRIPEGIFTAHKKIRCFLFENIGFFVDVKVFRYWQDGG